MSPATLAAILQFSGFLIRIAQDARRAEGIDRPLTEAELDVIAEETIRASRARGLIRADALDEAIRQRQAEEA